MKALRTIALAAALAPNVASALDFHPEVAARNWFLSANGTVQQTDIDAVDFDVPKGQPEFRVGLDIGERHHLNVSYLRIRREERAVVTAEILGILRFDDPLFVAASVDYVRLQYGYDLFASPWLHAGPFFELGVLREDTTVIEGLLGQSGKQSETLPVPSPGLAVEVAPAFPLRAHAEIGGIAVPGGGHLLDIEAGAEGEIGWLFAGAGYRYADVVIEDRVADVHLKGLYLEGGLRF